MSDDDDEWAPYGYTVYNYDEAHEERSERPWRAAAVLGFHPTRNHALQACKDHRLGVVNASALRRSLEQRIGEAEAKLAAMTAERDAALDEAELQQRRAEVAEFQRDAARSDRDAAVAQVEIWDACGHDVQIVVERAAQADRALLKAHAEANRARDELEVCESFKAKYKRMYERSAVALEILARDAKIEDTTKLCGCIIGVRRVCVKHCGGHAIPKDEPVLDDGSVEAALVWQALADEAKRYWITGEGWVDRPRMDEVAEEAIRADERSKLEAKIAEVTTERDDYAADILDAARKLLPLLDGDPREFKIDKYGLSFIDGSNRERRDCSMSTLAELLALRFCASEIRQIATLLRAPVTGRDGGRDEKCSDHAHVFGWGVGRNCNCHAFMSLSALQASNIEQQRAGVISFADRLAAWATGLDARSEFMAQHEPDMVWWLAEQIRAIARGLKTIP